MNPEALARYDREITAYAAMSRPVLQSVLVQHRGALIAEHYWHGFSASSRQPIYSVTKSVLSALAGMALAAGRLRLSDTLAECFPELPLEPGAHAASVTVQHLLTMTSGFQRASGRKSGEDPIPGLLRRPRAAPPGQRFAYSNDDVDLLAVILERALGEPALDYAQRCLFDPLDIWSEVPKSQRRRLWKSDRQGRTKGSHGLHLSSRELIRFGQLYLQGGQWQGETLISPDYLAASTMQQVRGGYPEQLPYGYLWWITRDRDGQPAYFASGAGGQYLCIFPARALVIAITSTLKNLSGLSHRVMITRMVTEWIGPEAGCQVAKQG